ncbi:MAG: DUF3857 domain-containing protein [Terriglobales bacterium]
MKLLRLLTVLFCSSLLFAQEKAPVAKAPAAGLPSAPSAVKSDNYAQEPFVVESQRTAFRFEDDGTGRKEVVARIRVQTEAAVEQLGQLVVGYNSGNESVELPYVRVRKADGSIVTAPPSAVQDLTAPVAREAPVYTDFRQKHITVPGLRPGDVLEYQIVTITQTPLAAGHFWMEHNFYETGIILDDQLEVNVPRHRKLKLKTKEGYDPQVRDEGDRRVYTWSRSHKQREDDDSAKKARKQRRSARADEPDVQLTTFSSWEELGRWYANLERDRRLPSPEVRARAAEIVKGRNTDMEKLQAIYDYVAKNFRYVSLSFGVGRYQPHSAADVLANQYGDCKDKHTLLAGLLEAVGLHASSVLINSARKIDPDVPSPSQFDHVISMVPLGKEQVWLDTTTEIAPFRLITFNLRKKQALVVPPSGTPRLMETPADAPVLNTQLVEISGKVSELGKLSAHVSITSSGDSELPLRSGFRQVPGARWKDLAQMVAQLEGLRGEVSDVKAGDPSDTRGPYHLEFDVAVPNFLDWSSRKSQIDLPLGRLRMPDLSDREDSSSSEPAEIGAPGTETMRLKLELPASFSARIPLPFEMKRDYAEYRAQYDWKGNTFTAERAITVRWRELPRERLRDYAAFRRAVVADEAQQLALESSQQGTPKPPANVKTEELYEAAQNAYQAQNYRAAIELFKRVVELESKHKSAWNDLGAAYLAVRRIDDAISALQKQIEINPYHEIAYNNLGRAYWDKRQYDRAADAFHKQIEINPLDKYSHRALGTLYLEQHKNREALAELQKAVSLLPQDPLVWVTLGQAQLELGENDKAVEAFDHAVNLSASPMVWNNIAYQLSLRNVHLDRAQQYAESAVASTAAALRNLTADRAQYEQQALVISLGAQWDTLGWVYFQRGKFEQAEQYVRAAWLLGQHGEVGDHLAQIYEKEGKKELAIKTYAEALAAYKPLPETRGRLAALVGEKKVDALVQKAAADLTSMRTVALGSGPSEAAQADFYIVVGPGAKVEDTRFISGSDQLKTFGEALRTAKFNFEFPDATPTRLLRRGTLSCAATGGCQFVLLPADDLAGAQ